MSDNFFLLVKLNGYYNQADIGCYRIRTKFNIIWRWLMRLYFSGKTVCIIYFSGRQSAHFIIFFRKIVCPFYYIFQEDSLPILLYFSGRQSAHFILFSGRQCAHFIIFFRKDSLPISYSPPRRPKYSRSREFTWQHQCV